MHASHSIMPLLPEQTLQAATVLARAFQDYPVFVAAMPQPEARSALLPPLFQRILRYSLRFGRVETTASLGGIACWIRPGEAQLGFWRMFRFGFFTMAARLGWASYQRFRAGQDVTDRLHRQYAPMPHWYLWTLGVDPQHQGTGVGGALLRTRLEELRLAGMACYLETHDEANVVFYEKHGFRVVAQETVGLTGLHIWAMLQQAKQDA